MKECDAQHIVEFNLCRSCFCGCVARGPTLPEVTAPVQLFDCRSGGRVGVGIADHILATLLAAADLPYHQ